MPPHSSTNSAFRKGAASTNPDRFAKKGDTSQRTKADIQRLNMYKTGKPIRDKKGKILGGDFLSKDRAGNQEITATTGRVAPDRRWFGNTRVVGAAELDSFRDAMAARMHDPYAVVLNTRSLPMGLLADAKATSRAHLLSAESFSGTFGAKATRKRVKLGGAVGDLSGLAASAATAGAEYLSEEHVDRDRVDDGSGGGDRAAARASVFDKGQSKRIWGELYKTLDCSDVVVQVLDARDPAGTRSPIVERFLKEHARHKHLVFILNKCDLVPTWVTRRWVAALSAEHPTLAFHASLTKPFGKGALIALLRQFSRLHADKKNISVGFIGYPNVGKSSIINALSGKKVCTVAPIPGETKVWQYVTLMKRVFLVDCPGVVPPNASDSEASIVVKGVVRATKLEAPEEYMPDLFARVKPAHLAAVYGVPTWTDPNDFLGQLATKQGRMLKGGEPDVSTVARNVLFDWQRGKLPYYAVPPDAGPGAAPAAAAAAAAALPAAGGTAGSVPSGARAPLPAAGAGAGASSSSAGSSSSGVAMAPQVLPRLGAHALLADEEEEDDRRQVPITAGDGEGLDLDDEGEGDEGEGDEGDEGVGDAAGAAAAAGEGAGPARGSKGSRTGKKKKLREGPPGKQKKGSGVAAAAPPPPVSSSSSSAAAAAPKGKKRARPVDEADAAAAAADTADSAPPPSKKAAVDPSTRQKEKGKKREKGAATADAFDTLEF